jgi:hypothetical protein
LVVGALLTVCALSAVVAVADASAVELLVLGSPAVAGEKFMKELIELPGASLLKTSLGLVKVEIECEHVELVSAETLSATDADAEIQFLVCKVLRPANCTVAEPIVVKALAIPETGGILFEPEAGETFVEVTLGVCAIKGTYAIKGTQLCELLEATTSQNEHGLECLTTGSALTFDSETATLVTQEIPLLLEPDMAWAVD